MSCYNGVMSGEDYGFKKKDNFENYVELFGRGISIKKLNPLKNQTYKVLVKSNVDVRVIDRDTVLDLLIETKCTQLRFFTADSAQKSRRYFYAIPVQAPNGEYVGFIYRTLFSHEYSSAFKPFSDTSKKVPYMFGFYRDFDNYDGHTTSMPIVVCESAKDAIVLKHFYPYTLANNTSRLGVSSYVLANITDKIILAYDNDKTGLKYSQLDKKILSDLGCSVDILKYDDGFKDVSDYIDHPQELRRLREQLKNRIKGLIHGTSLAV